MQDKTTRQPNNFLWQARRRSGLTQKNVAFLLNQKSTNDLSLYESGQRVPNLLKALKLEVIYRVPVRILFNQLYSRAMWQVRESRLKLNKQTSEGVDFVVFEKQMKHGNYCTYADLLAVPNLPRIEREKVRDHLIYLANTLSKIDNNNLPNHSR
jgi:transcriptional regulator with XRE-family HTH domain